MFNEGKMPDCYDCFMFYHSLDKLNYRNWGKWYIGCFVGNQYFDFTVKGSWKNKSSPFVECKRKYGEKNNICSILFGRGFIEHAAAEIGLARNCCNCCADGVAQYSSL